MNNFQAQILENGFAGSLWEMASGQNSLTFENLLLNRTKVPVGTKPKSPLFLNQHPKVYILT